MKNNLYISIILIFVFTTLVTVYTKIRIDDNKVQKETQEEVMTLSSGWSKNKVSNNKITIYGSYYLSTDLDSNISNDYYCQTDDCEFITGNDNYALIRDNGYIIFNLSNKGSYSLSDFSYDLEDIQFLVNNGVLYGLIYRENNHDFYYSLDTNTYYFNNDNIEIDYNSKYVIDKNELIIVSNNVYILVNYLTMEHLIEASMLELDYYEKENDYLIIASDYKGDIINVYTSSLNTINLPVMKKASLYNKYVLLTEDDKSFVVKDFNNETIMTSEEYDIIYDFINGYIIAKQGDDLLILNTSNEVLNEISLKGREYDHIRSGYYNETVDNMEGLYLYIGTNLDWQEIYFNPVTLELSTRDV